MMTAIYSKRFTGARGWHWKKERDVSPEDAKQWLAEFQKDEPAIAFAIADKEPKREAARVRWT